MPEFNVEVIFDVYCSCGEALCNQSSTKDYDHTYRHTARAVTVAPCEACKSAAYDEGYQKCEQDNDL